MSEPKKPTSRWARPLKAVGFFALMFPVWILGVPGNAKPDSPQRTGWTLGLVVILLYPVAVLVLYLLSRLHRLVSRRDALQPDTDEVVYTRAANVLLALALLGIGMACARMMG